MKYYCGSPEYREFKRKMNEKIEKERKQKQEDAWNALTPGEQKLYLKWNRILYNNGDYMHNHPIVDRVENTSTTFPILIGAFLFCFLVNGGWIGQILIVIWMIHVMHQKAEYEMYYDMRKRGIYHREQK